MWTRYPVLATVHSTLHPGRPVHSNINSTSLRSIQPCCNYCTNTIRPRNRSHIHHSLLPSTNLQLGELRQSGINKIAQALKWQMDSKLGSLDWESNVLTICHSAPCNNAKMHKIFITQITYFLHRLQCFTAEHRKSGMFVFILLSTCRKKILNKHPACFPLHDAQNNQVLWPYVVSQPLEIKIEHNTARHYQDQHRQNCNISMHYNN